MKLPLARDGFPFLAPALLATALFAAFRRPWEAAVCAAASIFLLQFFRDPDRRTIAVDGDIVSPADGTILEVGEAPASEAPDALPRKIVIFMSVFNCHVNRAPITGTISGYAYFPGKKLAAFSPKASTDNEQNRIEMTDGAGRRIVFKQIAGALARRIVFRKKPGDPVVRGDRVGMIRFGSRVDVFLPAGAAILVSRGSRVKAGLTVLGRMPARAS